MDRLDVQVERIMRLDKAQMARLVTMRVDTRHRHQATLIEGICARTFPTILDAVDFSLDLVERRTSW